MKRKHEAVMEEGHEAAMEEGHEDVSQSSLNVCPLAPAKMKSGYYQGKCTMLRGLRLSYESNMQPLETPRVFGAIHQAAFSVLGPEAIDTVSHDQAKLRGLADTVQSMATYWAIPKQAASVTDNESAPEVVATDPEPAASQEPTGSNARENIASRTLRFMRGRLHRSSVPQKRARDDTLPGADNEALGLVVPGPSARPKDRNQRVANEAKERDGLECIFTNAKATIDAAHILPHSINAADDHVSFFSMIVPHLTTMFGETFANRLADLLGSRGASDEPWNILTLDASLHRLFDKGLIGFRPDKITKTIRDGDVTFNVHLSIHWLWKTQLQFRHKVAPTSRTVDMMQAMTPDYQLHRKKYGIHHKMTDKRIHDGTLVSIEQYSLEDAQKMYDCLGMSWAMRMILCLAGGAGVPTCDPKDDDDFHESEATNELWDEFENHEAILDECFGRPEKPAVATEPAPALEPLPAPATHCQETSEESAGDTSTGSRHRWSPVPSLSGNFPFTSAMFRRSRSSGDSSEDSSQGSSSLWSRVKPPSSRTTVDSTGKGKATGGGGQIELLVPPRPLPFPLNPENWIPELEMESISKSVGTLSLTAGAAGEPLHTAGAAGEPLQTMMVGKDGEQQRTVLYLSYENLETNHFCMLDHSDTARLRVQTCAAAAARPRTQHQHQAYMAL
ncbi:Galactose-binding domain [Cordyceps militaris]|uniref:Galactose-binding domain n=1 Tax=Cordyceps militaris TaxID=73501 RepID=A0A2H4SCS4_CORMI|nr:Galactose-binding domain [Cordyceps militaris]